MMIATARKMRTSKSVRAFERELVCFHRETWFNTPTKHYQAADA
jgi:hypothetical protein